MTDEELLYNYMNVKRAENDAKEARIKMEALLLERFGDRVDDDKSSKSFMVGRYSVKIKRNISYSLNDEGWAKVNNMPYDQRPIDVKFSYSKGKLIPELVMDIVTKETKPSFEVVYK